MKSLTVTHNIILFTQSETTKNVWYFPEERTLQTNPVNCLQSGVGELRKFTVHQFNDIYITE